MEQPARRTQFSQNSVEGGGIERCARAFAELAHEVGPRAVTPEMVAGRVDMPRAAFFGLFPRSEEAVGSACEVARDVLLEPVEAAAESPGRWEERLEATIGALLETVREEPYLAGLCFVHAPFLLDASGPYDRAFMETFAGILQEILPKAKGYPLPRYSELAASGIVAIIARRLSGGEADLLGDLRGELTAVISIPYLRAEAEG